MQEREVLVVKIEQWTSGPAYCIAFGGLCCCVLDHFLVKMHATFLLFSGKVVPVLERGHFWSILPSL